MNPSRSAPLRPHFRRGILVFVGLLGLVATVWMTRVMWSSAEDKLDERFQRAARERADLIVRSFEEPLKQFVDGQISTGRYSSASEYVRELIRADEKRKAEEQLEAKLLEGLNSTESELTAADWCALRKEALAKIEARKPTR